MVAFPRWLRAQQLSPERDHAGTGVPWNLVQKVSWWDGGQGTREEGREEEGDQKRKGYGARRAGRSGLP